MCRGEVYVWIQLSDSFYSDDSFLNNFIIFSMFHDYQRHELYVNFQWSGVSWDPNFYQSHCLYISIQADSRNEPHQLRKNNTETIFLRHSDNLSQFTGPHFPRILEFQLISNNIVKRPDNFTSLTIFATGKLAYFLAQLRNNTKSIYDTIRQ